jgi:hypothetical protein
MVVNLREEHRLKVLQNRVYKYLDPSKTGSGWRLAKKLHEEIHTLYTFTKNI